MKDRTLIQTAFEQAAGRPMKLRGNLELFGRLKQA